VPREWQAGLLNQVIDYMRFFEVGGTGGQRPSMNCHNRTAIRVSISLPPPRSLLVGAEGWTVRRATDINDNGEITAWVCDATNAQCLGVLLSPVPEPATYGTLLAGLGLVGWARRNVWARLVE